MKKNNTTSLLSRAHEMFSYHANETFSHMMLPDSWEPELNSYFCSIRPEKFTSKHFFAPPISGDGTTVHLMSQSAFLAFLPGFIGVCIEQFEEANRLPFSIFFRLRGFSPISGPLHMWDKRIHCIPDWRLSVEELQSNDPFIYWRVEELKNWFLIDSSLTSNRIFSILSNGEIEVLKEFASLVIEKCKQCGYPQEREIVSVRAILSNGPLAHCLGAVSRKEVTALPNILILLNRKFPQFFEAEVVMEIVNKLNI